MPLLYGIDGGSSEGQRTLQELDLFNGTITANEYLQNYSALQPAGPRRLGIGRLNLLRQKCACCGLG